MEVDTVQKGTDRQRTAWPLALRLALAYAIAAGLWIVLSDRALGWLHLSHAVELEVASLKGLGFVVVTATLLFLLALGFVRRERASQKQYETFIDATDEMASLKDPDLRYLFVNQAGAHFLRRRAPDVVGRTDDEILPPGRAEANRTADLRALAAGAVVVSHDELDERLYETRTFPVPLADGRSGVGAYVRDVTERRRAEEEVARLNADLERRVTTRTAQLEATNKELESFAYAISHDLRSPLRALDGFSEILIEDYGDTLDDTARGHLRRIRGAAGHMSELMDGLLQLSRLNRDELELQPVDLSLIASQILADLSEGDPDRMVDVCVAPDLVAEADPRLVRILLQNLLGNAWKFTSRHDSAVIEVGAEPGGSPPAFFVRDDGAGFDPRFAEKLFRAFQRLHTADQFEGNGIGLATVQRIAHRHGGRVWATGAVEKGATFWFTFGPSERG